MILNWYNKSDWIGYNWHSSGHTSHILMILSWSHWVGNKSQCGHLELVISHTELVQLALNWTQSGDFELLQVTQSQYDKSQVNNLEWPWISHMSWYTNMQMLMILNVTSYTRLSWFGHHKLYTTDLIWSQQVIHDCLDLVTTSYTRLSWFGHKSLYFTR